MPLHEFHPICDTEIAKLPQTPGVYLVFQIQIPIYVDSADNLREAVQGIKAKFPRATHFSVEQPNGGAEKLAARVQKLREDLKLVRVAAFVGPPS
ncbi:MAG TPA: hypothetical protein VFA89_00710 [Terriglobales bacterium]|nr:hypothetical protein [Terriglobales bacterium]